MNSDPPKRPLSDSGESNDPTSTQPARKRDRANQQNYVFMKGSQSMPIQPSDGAPPFAAEESESDATSHLEQNLLELKVQRLREYHQAVYIPPMAKASLRSRDEDLFSLMDKVQEFLESEREVMLILGDAGSGKSTFNRHLEHLLWTNYNNGDPIPLFINLSAIDQPNLDLATKQLLMYNFDDDQILEMKKHRQFVIICDGYDESQQSVNLHDTNLLNREGQWSTKMIISCRSQYLSQNYLSRFIPQSDGHYGRPALHLFQEAVIAPFLKDQIETYVGSYVPLEPRTWASQDYMDKLAAIPNLMDLVRNPFLLTLALDTLPALTEGKQDLSTIKLTRVLLYDTFVVYWLGVNKRRLESNTLSADEREVFIQLLDAGFISMGVDFSTRLALAIFDKQGGNPVVKYNDSSDETTWRAEFFGPKPEVRLLRESIPLMRSGNLHQFIHRSMLEYFFSCAFFDPCTTTDHDEFTPQQDPGASVTRSLDPDGPLFKQDLLKEPSILQFLYERVPHSPVFKQQLLTAVERSKSDPGYSRAAANAMAILVKARVRFNGADLRGIKIPGADLFGGQFDTATFQGADLTNANLTRTWIRQADFTGAEMTGARFGVLPPMTESCPVFCCAFSPDGTTLAAGLKNGGISLYDTSTWAKFTTLCGHTRRVTSVAFSPTGPWLVSGSHDNTVRLWDSQTHLSRTLEGHSNKVLKVIFSPDGYMIASASVDATVRVWNSESGETELVYEGHERAVTSISWSPDGSRIASGSYDRSIQVWDPLTGAEVIERQCGDRHSILCIEFSPDGRWIISAGFGGGVYLRDATSNTIHRILAEYSDNFHGVVFSRDGRWMSTCDSHVVKLWDMETFTERTSWKDHSRFVKGLAFSADSSYVVSCSLDQTIRRFELNTVDMNLDPQYDFSPFSAFAYSTDGHHILSNQSNLGLYRWDPSTGACERLMVLEESQYEGIFSPNRDYLAASHGNDHSITVWDVVSGTPNNIFQGHTWKIKCLAYSPCGSWIASGSDDKTVRLWNLQDDTLAHVLVGHTNSIYSVAFSPDGFQLASGSSDNTIRLWDTRTRTLIKTLKGHYSTVICVSYSPDGATLASNSWDYTVAIWDLRTRAPRVVFADHNDTPQSLAFSSCGKWIASGDFEGCVYLRRIPLKRTTVTSPLNHRPIRCLRTVYSIVWNPSKTDDTDHLEFVTGSCDGAIRVWRMTVDPEDQVHFCLVWGTHVFEMASHDTKIADAIHLSEYNQKFLVQGGADGHDPQSDTDDLEDESEPWTDDEDGLDELKSRDVMKFSDELKKRLRQGTWKKKKLEMMDTSDDMMSEDESGGEVESGGRYRLASDLEDELNRYDEWERQGRPGNGSESRDEDDEDESEGEVGSGGRYRLGSDLEDDLNRYDEWERQGRPGAGFESWDEDDEDGKDGEDGKDDEDGKDGEDDEGDEDGEDGEDSEDGEDRQGTEDESGGKYELASDLEDELTRYEP